MLPIEGNYLYNIEEKLTLLCEKAEKLLADVRALQKEELLRELPALRLRLRHLRSSFEECKETLDRLQKDPEDPASEKAVQRFRTVIGNEMRWIEELGASLDDCAEASRQTEAIEKTRKAADFRSVLKKAGGRE